MNMKAFKKFFLYYIQILGLSFISYILLDFLFNKSKPHIVELFIIFSIYIIACLAMGWVGSYLSKQQFFIYNIKDGYMTIDMISKTLNKSGYSCDSDKVDPYEGELIYSSTPRIEKFYGKVYVIIYKDTIEVKAPRILFIKYLNKLK